MRFTGTRVLICVRPVGTSGFPPPRRPRRFRRGLAALTGRRPRLVYTNRFILFFSAPLQSPSASSPARALLERRRLPWGCHSLIATSTGGIVTAGFPCPSPSVLGVSHALDGFIRHRPRGFVSPHSHVQGSPERDSPPRTAGPPRRRPVPSRRCLKTATGSCPPAPRSPAPPSGPCSVPGSVATNDGV